MQQQKRLTTLPSMIDDSANKKILKKIRSSHVTKGVSNESSRNEPLENASNKICVNPIERLCTLLLDWEMLSSGSKSSREQAESFQSIPLSFPSTEDYIRTWEPLLVDEIKENLMSNIPMSTRKSCTGKFRVSEAFSKCDSTLVKLSCAWQYIADQEIKSR